MMLLRVHELNLQAAGMCLLPRVALGTVQSGTELSFISWALMDALERRGLRVQSFLSKACFFGRDGATVITGLSPRHLDSWLMTSSVCRDLFGRSASSRDLAIVEGSFATVPDSQPELGGDLDTLCQWLHLPRMAVIDASRIGNCRLPPKPRLVDGLLLDRVADASQFYSLQTNLEALWGIPVLGSLDALPELRAATRNAGQSGRPSREQCAALGDNFLQRSRIDDICRLAASRDFPHAVYSPTRGDAVCQDIRVAMAYDDAFNCYFPDTLDTLEQLGATVHAFSPLRDERLPPDTDIVYLGCGHPERFAASLAGNHCLMMALRNHLCEGRRIYAEGGGLAYLCRQIETSEGRRSMVGVLPAIARRNPEPAQVRPVELTMAQDTWLGRADATIRGYLNTAWLLEPTGPLANYAREPAHRWDLVGRHQAIGSRLHLNFAAQPFLLQHFLRPHSPALAWAAAR